MRTWESLALAIAAIGSLIGIALICANLGSLQAPQ
jgi:hypothetical protein